MSIEPILPGDAGPPEWQDDPEKVADVEDFLRDLDAPSPDLATPTRGLSLRPLVRYAVRRVIWLDKWFLQRAAFHLLAGRKGSLKGTFIALLAALVTRGDLYGEPKRVLVVTSEDSVELDFKPRVLAAGGDETLVEIVTGEFRMPRDLDWLRRKALELGDVGLIAIDPIGNHLGGKDTNDEGPVRDAIQDLNPIADELDCMVFGVRHLGKDTRRSALASVLGSTAWIDVPRCVILMARDDEDEWVFHAQVVAGNRGPRNHGRAYRLELVDVPPATEITLAVPQGESTKDVEDLLGVSTGRSEASKSTRARELILDLLEGCTAMESDELDARIGGETGLAAKTVRNIRSELGKVGLVAAYPEKNEDGKVVRWLVRRTKAPRPDQVPGTDTRTVNPGPDSPEASGGTPHKQARSLSGPLESISSDVVSRSLPAGVRDEDEKGTGGDPLDEYEVERLAAVAREAHFTETCRRCRSSFRRGSGNRSDLCGDCVRRERVDCEVGF